MREMDIEVAVINSNSSLSKETKENPFKSDVCVTAGKAGKRKRKVGKQDTFLEQLVEQRARHLSFME